MAPKVGPIKWKKVAAWASVANAEVIPNVHAYHVKRYRVKNKDGDLVMVEAYGTEPRNALMPKIKDGTADVMLDVLGADGDRVLAAIEKTWEDARAVLEDREDVPDGSQVDRS